MSAEVILFGTHWYCICRECEWRTAPQDSQSDAEDRAVTHDWFNHKDSPAAESAGEPPFDGQDESLLRQIEASP